MYVNARVTSGLPQKDPYLSMCLIAFNLAEKYVISISKLLKMRFGKVRRRP